MTSEDELKIIRKVLDGDKNAYEELVLANQKNIYNLAMKMTGNEDDALDISQEAFLKAYRQLGGFRGDSRFSVWLYRLTYNLCIDFLRKKPKAAVIPLTFQDVSGDVHDLELPDFRDLPEDKILRHETRKAISDGIDELGQDHREILIMREITGMSYGEIAEALGLSEGTVKSRLARARRSLVNILLEKGTFLQGYRHMNQAKIRREAGQDEQL